MNNVAGSRHLYKRLAAIVFLLILSTLLSSGQGLADDTAKDLGVIKGEDLPVLMKMPEPFTRSVAVYNAQISTSVETTSLLLNLFLAESDDLVKSMLLLRVAEQEDESLAACIDGTFIVHLIAEVDGVNPVLAVESHRMLERLLKCKLTPKSEKIADIWDALQEKYLDRHNKARAALNPPPVAAPVAGDEAEHDVVARKDARRNIPDVRRFDGESTGFLFGMDYSGSTRKAFETSRREMKYVLRLGLMMNAANSVGCLTFCSDIGYMLTPTSDPEEFEKGIAALRAGTRGTECHDLPALAAIEEVKWKAAKKMTLVITDEPFGSKTDPDKLCFKLKVARRDGFVFDVMQLTTQRETDKFSLKGFEGYLSEGGGSWWVYNPRTEPEFSATLALFFIKQEYRAVMLPFFKDMIARFREYDNRWK